MRRVLATVLPLCLLDAAGCRDVRFHLTDVSSSATGQGVLGQSFTYRGSILALCPASVADNVHNVVVRATRTSGANPSTNANEINPAYANVIVARGKGKFTVFGGYRTPGETWEPPLYEFTIVDYSRFARGVFLANIHPAILL